MILSATELYAKQLAIGQYNQNLSSSGEIHCPMFSNDREILLSLQDKVNGKPESRAVHGTLKPVETGEAANTSPVVGQGNKKGSLRHYVDLIFCVSAQVIDDYYLFGDKDIFFHNLHNLQEIFISD